MRHTIGYVAQDSGVDWEATGRENLLLQGRIHAWRARPLHARVDELLELVGLADAADRVARGYSGGMKRRLDIALGLVHKPRVLFLDEPTTGLDPEARAPMWVEVERLAVPGEPDDPADDALPRGGGPARRAGRDRQPRQDRRRGHAEELKAGLRGESVTVELADTDARAHEAVASCGCRRRERGDGRGPRSARARRRTAPRRSR